MPEAVDLDVVLAPARSKTQGFLPESALGAFVTLKVVSRPRRQRGAITLRRLILRDPKYRRLARRGDRKLGGVMIVSRYYSGPYRRRCRRRLIPRIGTEFTLPLTTASRRELRSIASCLAVTGAVVIVQPTDTVLVETQVSALRVPRESKSRGAIMPPAKTTEHWKIRFRDAETMEAALAAQAPSSIPVVNRQRRFVGLELPTASASRKPSEKLSFLKQLERDYHVEVEPDIQYSWEDSWDDSGFQVAADYEAQASLDDVLTSIHAREAWQLSRGAGVAIAIVDSGIDGRRREFPRHRRLTQIAFNGLDPWQDDRGHGTMCACIAAATRYGAIGEFEGVAPEAQLISCRTTYLSSEIVTIYDFLRAEKQRLNLPIVANNSWGPYSGTPPVADPDIEDALGDAVDAGIVLVFSAGNNHELIAVRHACSPNSIWRFKSRANLMSVATCALDGRMWEYSSRGPGEWSGQAGCNDKPDVIAPTPAYGRVLHGNHAKVLVNGWGTSGAAPQVSGLAGLVLSRWPGLDQAGVFHKIRSTAHDLGLPATCQGAGLIDCEAAVR
ncbi:MAG: S8/S53 family peptidase [Pirellulales bacterium]|nr:S8/S53 family peptidase [Pirellulales bacterium]